MLGVEAWRRTQVGVDLALRQIGGGAFADTQLRLAGRAFAPALSGISAN